MVKNPIKVYGRIKPVLNKNQAEVSQGITRILYMSRSKRLYNYSSVILFFCFRNMKLMNLQKISKLSLLISNHMALIVQNPKLLHIGNDEEEEKEVLLWWDFTAPSNNYLSRFQKVFNTSSQEEVFNIVAKPVVDR